MNNELIPLAITLVVGIILAGSVLMPVLNDATKTEVTFENEGYFHMTKYSASDEDLTLIWDSETPAIININGDDFDLSDVGIPVTVLASSNGGARFEYTSNNYCQFCNSAGVLTADVNNNVGSMSITCSGGTMTATYTPGPGASLENPVTRTSTYEEYYCISENGDYVMKKSTSAAYVLDDSPIFALGVTKIGSPAITLALEGNLTDGIAISQVTSTPTITYTTPVCDYVDDSKYIGLNELSKITFDADNSGTTVSVTYSYFIVPATVTAELTDHLTPEQIALMGAIPVLVIVALLVVAVGVVARRND